MSLTGSWEPGDHNSQTYLWRSDRFQLGRQGKGIHGTVWKNEAVGRDPEGLSAVVVPSRIAKYFPISSVQVGLPDWKQRNTGYTVKFELQISDK